ncbi:hypothetical protein KQX54_006657 [Cotesia glomerata]|uniref:Uncharacterized protein n=1 Tax=Cotesia glomerata TaxID=32391 RepID=A0AAV7IWI2_COTGL|nr:hypothetical protein KQX54_006657 [Cotesia glomerata]
MYKFGSEFPKALVNSSQVYQTLGLFSAICLIGLSNLKEIQENIVVNVGAVSREQPQKRFPSLQLLTALRIVEARGSLHWCSCLCTSSSSPGSVCRLRRVSSLWYAKQYREI